MNTLYLNYALEVERTGSITQAAQNLFMAQPNLSKALKELEKEIGFTIFNRTANGVKVTDEGAEFLFLARQINEQINAIGRIKEHNGNSRFNYKISIPRGSYIANGVTSFVSELKTENGMEITIKETNALGTIANVAERGYNTGILRYQVVDEHFFLESFTTNHLRHELIWEFEYVIVMSKKHPLANKPSITIDDLKKYTKITHGDIEIPHIKNADKDKEDEQENVIYVYERGSQFDLLSNVPTTYMWVSPIPKQLLEKNNLIQRVCKSKNNLYRDVIIYRKDYQINEFDKLFQKKLYEAKIDVANVNIYQ